jgi:hypothetical protein
MTREAEPPTSKNNAADADDSTGGGDVITEPPSWTKVFVFHPNPASSSFSFPPSPTLTATMETEPTKINTMNDFPPLPTQLNGAHLHNHVSYAQVAAHDAPPLSAQPHPDKSLLYTSPSPTHPTTAPDVDNKVSVVPHDWAAHPTTATSLHIGVAQTESDDHDDSDTNVDTNTNGSTKRKARKERERRDKTYKAKRDVNTSWRHFTDCLVHPSPALIRGVTTVRAYYRFSTPKAN